MLLLLLTHIFWGAKNLSELADCTQFAGQSEVYDLNVSERREAGEENILRLREEQRRKLDTSTQALNEWWNVWFFCLRLVQIN